MINEDIECPKCGDLVLMLWRMIMKKTKKLNIKKAVLKALKKPRIRLFKEF